MQQALDTKFDLRRLLEVRTIRQRTDFAFILASISYAVMTQLDYPVNVEDTLTVYFCLLLLKHNRK
jgi:hypothetical protein